MIRKVLALGVVVVSALVLSGASTETAPRTFPIPDARTQFASLGPSCLPPVGSEPIETIDFPDAGVAMEIWTIHVGSTCSGAAWILRARPGAPEWVVDTWTVLDQDGTELTRYRSASRLENTDGGASILTFMNGDVTKDTNTKVAALVPHVQAATREQVLDEEPFD
ncbi:hypothetical protein [Salininema proteolyticum]|uniref:Uncharacterized protein n=1 Tax=Salininema proteolyticum TaxID=1607685 RepID=A0ABV8U498_9ACTN